jgi:hypothetical protein
MPLLRPLPFSNPEWRQRKRPVYTAMVLLVDPAKFPFN